MQLIAGNSVPKCLDTFYNQFTPCLLSNDYDLGYQIGICFLFLSKISIIAGIWCIYYFSISGERQLNVILTVDLSLPTLFAEVLLFNLFVMLVPFMFEPSTVTNCSHLLVHAYALTIEQIWSIYTHAKVVWFWDHIKVRKFQIWDWLMWILLAARNLGYGTCFSWYYSWLSAEGEFAACGIRFPRLK